MFWEPNLIPIFHTVKFSIKYVDNGINTMDKHVGRRGGRHVLNQFFTPDIGARADLDTSCSFTRA